MNMLFLSDLSISVISSSAEQYRFLDGGLIEGKAYSKGALKTLPVVGHAQVKILLPLTNYEAISNRVLDRWELI